jgi:hypothetical protein
MSLASLSSEQLHHLLKLIEEKEAIEAKLAKIDQSLKALENGTTPQKVRVVSVGSRRGRRRVGLKNAILKKLQTAGQEGMTVKDLAASIGAKLGSVSVWFYTTGKTIKSIQKIGKSKFNYRP